MKQFNLDLDKFKKTYPSEFLKIQKKLVLEILTRVVDKSPVDTGRFRANWNTAIGRVDGSTTKDTDRSGTQARQECLNVLSTMDPYDTIFISNNLDYALQLEHGRSDQAPLGMVAVTVAEIQTFLREVIV